MLKPLAVKAGQIAVPQRDACKGDQRAVDRSYQASQERSVGCEPDYGCPGHEMPFLIDGIDSRLAVGSIYVYQMPVATSLFAWQE